MIFYLKNKETTETVIISSNTLPETRPVVGLRTAINSLFYSNEFKSNLLSVVIFTKDFQSETIENNLNNILKTGINKNDLIKLIMALLKL